MSHEIPIRRVAGIRIGRPPIAEPAQLIRAILCGLLLAFLFVLALPQARILLLSHDQNMRLHTLA